MMMLNFLFWRTIFYRFSSFQANNKSPKHNNKENNETVRHKAKVRPYSAGVIDSKKRDAAKGARFVTNSPKKSCKHENILEELKDTNERVKGLELLNVQLNEDNRVLRKKLDEVNEKKHVTELKLGECEKFLSRVGKEYENRNRELNEARDNENKLLAELNKERNERKNLKILHDKDASVIQDLQRQCKEMEMILKRKHPDSVSALIGMFFHCFCCTTNLQLPNYLCKYLLIPNNVDTYLPNLSHM